MQLKIETLVTKFPPFQSQDCRFALQSLPGPKLVHNLVFFEINQSISFIYIQKLFNPNSRPPQFESLAFKTCALQIASFQSSQVLVEEKCTSIQSLFQYKFLFHDYFFIHKVLVFYCTATGFSSNCTPLTGSHFDYSPRNVQKPIKSVFLLPILRRY